MGNAEQIHVYGKN